MLTGTVDEAIIVDALDTEFVVGEVVVSGVPIVDKVVDVVFIEKAEVDIVRNELVNGAEEDLVVVGVDGVAPLDEDEPKVECAVEVDTVVLDLVLVVINMEDNNGVTEVVLVEAEEDIFCIVLVNGTVEVKEVDEIVCVVPLDEDEPTVICAIEVETVVLDLVVVVINREDNDGVTEVVSVVIVATGVVDETIEVEEGVRVAIDVVDNVDTDLEKGEKVVLISFGDDVSEVLLVVKSE